MLVETGNGLSTEFLEGDIVLTPWDELAVIRHIVFEFENSYVTVIYKDLILEDFWPDELTLMYRKENESI